MYCYKCDPKFAQDELQRKIIYLDQGYHLLLAPPGCGKTDLLAERIVRALSRGIEPEKMLCLTFTNRAARGMQERIQERLAQLPVGDSVGANSGSVGFDAGVPESFAQLRSGEKRIFVGNVHRFCSHFLFENEILSQSVSILDEDESFLILQSLMGLAEEPIEDFESRKCLSDIIDLQHTVFEYLSGFPADLWQAIPARAQLMNAGIRQLTQFGQVHSQEEFSAFWAQGDFSKVLDKAPFAKLSKLSFSPKSKKDFIAFMSEYLTPLRCLELARDYQWYKEQNKLIDFEDLLDLAYAYTLQHPERIPHYTWIQVDEVQDLSPLQHAVIDAFTDKQHVTLYLGDEQQAIFSFIGAELSTLERLKQRCLGHVHHLANNYRSPRYLLDVFNQYARNELHVDPDLLPHTNNLAAPDEWSLSWVEAESKQKEAVQVAGLVKLLQQKYGIKLQRDLTAERVNGKRSENIAILVPWNKDADMISQALPCSHFKISGRDVFMSPTMKTLLACLLCCVTENNILAWAQVLYRVKAFKRQSLARKFVKRLLDNYVLPSDLINYDQSSYMLEFEKCAQGTYVIFDTETTGLDVFQDDVVQIAAFKVKQGMVIDEFSMLLHTDRPLAARLGDIVNPLVEEYANNPHVERREGLQRFLDFIEDLPLVGHNVEYDYHILKHNVLRTGLVWFERSRFDTLKAVRILQPHLRSYKLKFLLEVFQLAGCNSHLATDDVAATLELQNYLLEFFKEHRLNHLKCLQSSTAESALIKEKYGVCFTVLKQALYEYVEPEQGLDLANFALTHREYLAGDMVDYPGFVAKVQQYESHRVWWQFWRKAKDKARGAEGQGTHQPNHQLSTRSQANVQVGPVVKSGTKQSGTWQPAISAALAYLFKQGMQQQWFKSEARLDYVFEFIAHDVAPEAGCLQTLLDSHLLDLQTYREADLVESTVIHDNIFISTVHKAKGLEFDNVILFNVVDGAYPNFQATKTRDLPRIQEGARLLYVGMTRSKKRLILSHAHRNTGVSAAGQPYTIFQHVSPFLGGIADKFVRQRVQKLKE